MYSVGVSVWACTSDELLKLFYTNKKIHPKLHRLSCSLIELLYVPKETQIVQLILDCIKFLIS